MKNKQDVVKVDSRNRITIPKKMSCELDQVYKIYQKDGNIILEPIQQIPEREKWMLDPKNKDILKRLKKSLEEKPTINFDEFKKTLKKK
jgi:bifunctional DNA-binding transcriptional regulator/antitoxin component of YhaV-PrlF toxin-antitoxin module